MQYSENLILVSLNAKYIQSNTAVYYLHEVLISEGFSSIVLSHNINEDLHDILSSIYKQNPCIVCFSCYIWNIEMVYDLCHSIRNILPDTKIILGGPEVTYEPKRALKESGANLIIRGEAEDIITDVIKGLQKGNIPDTAGLFYKKDGLYLDTGVTLTKDLSKIPFPFTPYMMKQESEKLIYYESSRGCPYNCIYCLSSTTVGVRYLPIERVKKDLLKILEYKPKVIKFTDRSFNSNNERSMKLIDFIESLDTKTCFHLEIYPGTMKETSLNRLIELPAGRIQIEAGIQSINKYVLDASGRPQDSKKALANLSKLRKAGNMHVHADLIAGLPGEDIKAFKKSFHYTLAVLPHKLQVGFLKLLKGTKARNLPGYKYSAKPPYEVLSSDVMEYSQIQEIREIAKLLELFYNTGHFAKYFSYVFSEQSNLYTFFYELYTYIDTSGYSLQGISRNGKYNILASFSSKDQDAITYLAYDYLSSYRTRKLPDFLTGIIVSKEKAFEFLKTIPDGNAKQLYKSCTIAQLKINNNTKTYLFDYSKKDPVTDLFEVKSIDLN